MPAYNFQSRFASIVASGEKRQTIRATGKRHHAAIGDHIQLYTGMRTKACRKLVDPDPVCTFSGVVALCVPGHATVEVNYEPIEDIDEFAKADGFSSFIDMMSFFHATHGLPFVGVLIKW